MGLTVKGRKLLKSYGPEADLKDPKRNNGPEWTRTDPKRGVLDPKRGVLDPKWPYLDPKQGPQIPPIPPQQMPRWGEARHLLKNLTLA